MMKSVSVNDDLRILLRGKVGDNAARTLLETSTVRRITLSPRDSYY